MSLDASQTSSNAGVAKSISNLADPSAWRVYGLAIVLIAGFLFFYGVAMLTLSKDSTTGNVDFTALEKVTSTLGAIVAVVVGYYFGQRPVQQLSREIERVSSERDEAKKTRDQLWSLPADQATLEKRLESLAQEYDELKKLLGEGRRDEYPL